MNAPLRGGALVTGGSKRVGRVLCLALAEAGYAVAVHYRSDPTAAQALCREIVGLGGRAEPVQADLSDPEAAATLPARASRLVGALELLVNNASVFLEDRIQTLTRERWSAHLDTNLLAPILLTQAFAAGVEALAPTADPSVINMLDQRVLRLNPQFFSYTISKAALLTATVTLAQALAPRIRVNAVGPGPTLASIHQTADLFQREAAATPLARPSPPGDIAAAVVYLAGARSVTGQMIAVDAGQHLAWRTPDILEP